MIDSTELDKLNKLVIWLDRITRLHQAHQDWNKITQNSFRTERELARVEREIGWGLITLTP